MRRSFRQRWLTGLTAAVAVLYGWIGLSAQGAAGVVGVVGALTIVAALAVAGRSRRTAGALLVLGALPLAVLTWWSIVTPMLAVLCLAVGGPAIRRSTVERADCPASVPTPT